jgi:multidrug efflux pump subunit AcrB
MAGFAEVFGGVPLALAHLVGLILLLLVGWRAYGKRGIAVAIIAVIVSSGIGIIVAQILWQGELFQLGINNNSYIP